MAIKNKSGASTYIVRIIVFAIILGILAFVLIMTIGKEQVGKVNDFFGDRYFDMIGKNSFVELDAELDIYTPEVIQKGDIGIET